MDRWEGGQVPDYHLSHTTAKTTFCQQITKKSNVIFIWRTQTLISMSELKATQHNMAINIIYNIINCLKLFKLSVLRHTRSVLYCLCSKIQNWETFFMAIHWISLAFSVKDAYQRAPVRHLPAPPEILPAENKLEPCPWTWLSYIGITSFVLMIVGVVVGVLACCFCCRGTGGSSNI